MESQLKFVKKTAYEVSMKVVVKLEDITEDQVEALFKLELLWLPVDVTFNYQAKESKQEEAFTDSKDPKAQMLQTLGWLMQLYCTKNNIEISDEIRKVYEHNNVVSRRDLTEQQLSKLIGSYKAGLL